jgi:hypothetical protein
MFVAMTVFCIWFGWQVNTVRQRRAVLRKMEASRSSNEPWQILRLQIPIKPLRHHLPFWRRWMGDHAGPQVALINEGAFSREEIEEIKSLFPGTVFLVETATGEWEGREELNKTIKGPPVRSQRGLH